MAYKTLTYNASDSTAIFQSRPDENDRSSAQVVASSTSLSNTYDFTILLIKWNITGNGLYMPFAGSKVKVYQKFSSTGDYGSLSSKNIVALYEACNFSSVTYNSRPQTIAYEQGYWNSPEGQPFEGYVTAQNANAWDKDVVLFGAEVINRQQKSQNVTFYTSRSNKPPVLEITFEDRIVQMSVASTAPAAGSRLDKSVSNMFSFSTRLDGECIGTISIQSGSFIWRVKGQSAEHTISLSAGASSVTVPANTFPNGELEYKFRITPNAGNTFESAWIGFATGDTLSTAVALIPDGGIVNADETIKFAWEHRNSSGAPQTGAEISLNKDLSGWVNHRLPDSSEMSYDMPPGTITAGRYQWKVRTYNLDGSPGAWSDPKQFIAVGKPSAPVITAVDNTPRPTVKWQAEAQSAYQIQLDSEPPVSMYGTARQWKSPKYISDGNHTFKLRIQNEFGQWSDWSEAAVNTANVSGTDVTLAASADNSVHLSWTAEGYDFFIVYRDNVPIARTAEKSFTDDCAAGTVSYTVRGCFCSSGNYGMSNRANTVCLPEYPIIKAVGGEWISMELSENQYREVNENRSRRIKSRYLAGRELPVSAVSPYRSHSLDIEFSTDDAELCSRISGLVGRMVVVKTPAGSIARGYLSALPVRRGSFYSTYSIHVEDEWFPEVVKLD